MSSRPLIAEPVPAAPAKAAVVPLFACPGAKETNLDALVFPHGGGFTQLTPCPGREICLWYAAHDLGADGAINELPPEVVVAADFRTRPFSCKRFQEQRSRALRSRRRRAAQSRWRVAALVGLVEFFSVLAWLDLTDVISL